MVQNGYLFFAILTLLAHFAILQLVLVRILPKKIPFIKFVHRFWQTHVYNLIFISTVVAMLGSLFFSEIAKFTPCVLCWYQRILMYPQLLLVGIATWRNETSNLKPYLIALNLVGLAISLYHNFLLWFPQYAELVDCSAKGGPSCIKGYTFYFGYITIPLMAFTVFGFNLLLLWFFTKKTTS